MNPAILQRLEEHEREGEKTAYAVFVSPRSGRMVACLFVRDVEAYRPLIGKRFDIEAHLSNNHGARR